MKSVVSRGLQFLGIASSLLVSTNPAFSGEKGNGGDLVLGYFVEGRTLAMDYLRDLNASDLEIADSIPAELVDHGFNKNSMKVWIEKNRLELLKDLAMMKFELVSDEQKSCAVTNSTYGSKVTLSSKVCSPLIKSPDEAAWLVIGEAAHHIPGRSGWPQNDEDAFAAFMSMITRTNWEKFQSNYTPSCQQQAQLSAALKIAITAGNLKSVQSIVGDRGFDIHVGYVDKNCNITGNPVEDSASIHQYWTDVMLWTNAETLLRNFKVFKYLIEQGGDFPRHTLELPNLYLISYNTKVSWLRREEFYRVADEVFAFYFDQREYTGLTAEMFAAYTLGMTRSVLMPRLESVISHVNMTEVAKIVASRALIRVDRKSFEVLEEHGLVLTPGTVNELFWLTIINRSQYWDDDLDGAFEWFIQQGARIEGQNKKILLESLLRQQKEKSIEEAGFLRGFAKFLEYREQLDLDFSIVLGEDQYTFADWVFFIQSMYKISGDTYQKIAENPRTPSDDKKRTIYKTKQFQKRHEMAIEVLKKLQDSGFSPTGKCLQVEVPRPNQDLVGTEYSISETGPKIMNFSEIGTGSIQLPGVLKWNYYDSLEYLRNKIPPVKVAICGKAI